MCVCVYVIGVTVCVCTRYTEIRIVNVPFAELPSCQGRGRAVHARNQRYLLQLNFTSALKYATIKFNTLFPQGIFNLRMISL